MTNNEDREQFGTIIGWLYAAVITIAFAFLGWMAWEFCRTITK